MSHALLHRVKIFSDSMIDLLLAITTWHNLIALTFPEANVACRVAHDQLWAILRHRQRCDRNILQFSLPKWLHLVILEVPNFNVSILVDTIAHKRPHSTNCILGWNLLAAKWRSLLVGKIDCEYLIICNPGASRLRRCHQENSLPLLNNPWSLWYPRSLQAC